MLRQSDALMVTAVGWVPSPPASLSQATRRSPVNVAFGAGFAVGSIYDSQTYSATLSSPATLVITFTASAAAGIDPSHIQMFRWDNSRNNWQPLPAVADTAHNTFTGTISQLGTYTLGYDATPQINNLTPGSGDVLANQLPLISASLSDLGSGVDPASVHMTVDGQIVPATYLVDTGELAYLLATPLMIGVHTVTVSATDVARNAVTVTATFRIAMTTRFTPIVLRRS